MPAVSAPASTTSASIASAPHALRFMLAGDAHITFVSMKTGTRFTYNVRLADRRPGDTRPLPHFVSVLTAPEHYEFLGTLFDGKGFAFGKKSRISQDAPSAKAFLWVWRHLRDGKATPDLEIHHEGRCGRCGRRLTVPESIETGLGPECAKKS